MIKHFLTFGGGAEWPHAARRLAEQARSSNFFDTISVITDSTIFDLYSDFGAHSDFVDKNHRGWGYWIWKPFLIKKALERISSGEMLFYLDAGFELPHLGHKNLARMFNKMRDPDVLFFDYASIAAFNVIFWSKQSLQDIFINEYKLNNIAEIPQVSSGTLGFVKTDRSVEVVDLWYRLSCSAAYSYINDDPPIPYNKTLFFENRHDQAVITFALAYFNAKSSGDALAYDYRLPDLVHNPELNYKPLLAMRNRTSASHLNYLEITGKRYHYCVKYLLQRFGIIREPVSATRLIGNYLIENYGNTASAVISSHSRGKRVESMSEIYSILLSAPAHTDRK